MNLWYYLFSSKYGDSKSVNRERFSGSLPLPHMGILNCKGKAATLLSSSNVQMRAYVLTGVHQSPLSEGNRKGNIKY